MEEYTAWLELQAISNEELNERKAFEDALRKTIKAGDFDKISAQLTPRALTKCHTNALLMAMETNFELRRLANKKGPDEEDFTKLAASLDEFISCLFDPLKTGGRIRDVFLKASIDDVMDAAIEFKQKKFFAHPVINNLMTEKWHGELGRMKKYTWLSTERWTWAFLNIWCLFDFVLFPLLFIIFGGFHFVRRKIRSRNGVYINKRGMYGSYLKYFTTPYFIFVRDTLSYLAHLGLHFAICLAPSSIPFSILEWVVWVFYMGRIVMESKQLFGVKVLQQHKVTEAPSIKEPMASGSVEVLSELNNSSIKTPRTPSSLGKKFSKYLSDRWNVLDLTTLIIYLIIFVLRMITWAMSDSVVSNRALVIAGYLYGLNTMFLTFRVFGHVMETTRGVGSIQIALFHILSDVATIFWQFIAAILAFSIAITKVYVAEKSFLAKEDSDNNHTCRTVGFSCWWTIARHLCWSLLGIVELDPLDSTDIPSVTVVRFLYGAFLIMGVILLINMMIALLSNTYTRVEENSLKEWSFKKAIRVQTYSTYDPIPVPFNLISNLALGLQSLCQYFCFCLRTRREREPEVVTNDGNRNLVRRTRRPRMEEKMIQLNKESLDLVVRNLQVNYFGSYGYTFPLTDKGKMDHVLQETKRIRPITNQIAYNTFISHGRGECALPTGPTAWKSEGMRVVECLLMYEGVEFCQTCKDHPTASQRNHGARYLVPFSPEFPRFEVLILEAGECRSLEVGVARENYQSHLIRNRGWQNECVGYHIKGDIFDAITANTILEVEDAMAERGDLIGCTVLFDMAENGKVPILFTLNGKQITQASVSIEFDQENLLLFPFVSMGHEGVVVSAKMRPRDNVEWLPILASGDILPSKNSKETSSAEGHENTDVYGELEYAGAKFRRIRDDMLDNLRTNFRRLEDVFNDWNKQCLQMSSSFARNKVSTGVIEQPALIKKIKDALDGLREIEELERKVNQKFGTVLKELTTRTENNY